MTKLMTALATILALTAAPVAMALQSAPAPAPVEAAPAASGELSLAERKAILETVAKSMADVKTAKGMFTQMSPDYTVITGELALKRPGKVRFDYDDPTPVLIVSNGATVAIQDADLETTDRVPLGSTPLKILLDDKLDFDAETDVVDVARYDGMLGVTVRDSNGEMDGTLTLLFRETDNEMLGWRTVDSAGGVTVVELSNMKYGEKLNPRLFIMDDFEDED